METDERVVHAAPSFEPCSWNSRGALAGGEKRKKKKDHLKQFKRKTTIKQFKRKTTMT